MWPDSFSFVYSLVSRVTSSVRVYLLAMMNIVSDILVFFMMSLWIRDGSLSPFLKNITIDLSSIVGVIFLLLQKCWMNPQKDSPFFKMTLARSQSTLEHVHVAWKLLVNSWLKWFQERTDLAGSLRS
jgi:hypothetical protein